MSSKQKLCAILLAVINIAMIVLVGLGLKAAIDHFKFSPEERASALILFLGMLYFGVLLLELLTVLRERHLRYGWWSLAMVGTLTLFPTAFVLMVATMGRIA